MGLGVRWVQGGQRVSSGWMAVLETVFEVPQTPMVTIILVSIQMWSVNNVDLHLLSLQVPWAPLEACQALLGVMGWLELLVALENVGRRVNQVQWALQVSSSGYGVEQACQRTSPLQEGGYGAQ